MRVRDRAVLAIAVSEAVSVGACTTSAAALGCPILSEQR
jgi:hypothetical protein